MASSSSRNSFNTSVEDKLEPIAYSKTQLTFENLKKCAQQQQYKKLQSLLLIFLDDLDDIQSSIVVSANYPTGIALVRDARLAKNLDERLPTDAPIIVTINTILRALTTMRAIIYTLEKHARQDMADNLKQTFNHYFQNVLEKGQKNDSDQFDLNDEEKNFNSEMVKILHFSQLGEGCSLEDYPKLLLHYRDLASTLDPAMSMETILEHRMQLRKKNPTEIADVMIHGEISHPITEKTENGHVHVTYREDMHPVIEQMDNETIFIKNGESASPLIEESDDDQALVILHREIAHPITEKTHEQKNQLNCIKPDYCDYLDNHPKNFHSEAEAAYRIANVAFKNLILCDKRRLSAQAIRTIAPTLKNAYIVYNELEFPQKICPYENKTGFWSLRCGSMVYIGQGETKESRAKYTAENLDQLFNAAKKHTQVNMKLHITMLLTHSYIMNLDDQNLIIEITQEQSKLKDISWSHVQTNYLGLLNFLSISSKIHLAPSRFFFDTRKTRMEKAGQIMHRSSTENVDILNLATCVEGMDRTGTAMEIGTENRVILEYEKFRLLVSREDIERVRALGCHNAYLASFARVGSPGMKPLSKPANLFLEKTAEYFYRKTAMTNQSAPINEKYLAEIFRQSKDSNEANNSDKMSSLRRR